MNFENLTFTKKSEPIIYDGAHKARYIIGCDPFEVPKKEGHLVIVIYDKLYMRVTTKIETKKTFDKFVEDYLQTEADKRMYKISKKFVNESGYAISPSELPDRNNSNSLTSEGYSSTLES